MYRKIVRVAQGLLPYLIALAIGCGVLVMSLDLRNADFEVPFYYEVGCDNDLFYEMCRSASEHGWYFTDPNLGAPGAMDLHDLPMLDTLHFFCFKIIGYFTDNSVLVFNLYYLAGYPLSILTCLFVLRHLGISTPIAVATSLLFAFLPYHFWRSNWHIFLAAYFMIPLGIMVALWVAQGRVLFVDRREGKPPRFRLTGRGAAAIAIVAVISTTGVYYAYFMGFFLIIAGLIALMRRPSLLRMIDCGSLCLFLIASVVIQASPFLLYWREHGKNPIVANRGAAEAQLYALDLYHQFLPTVGHHVPMLISPGRYKQEDLTRSPIRKRLEEIPENSLNAFGVIGSVGCLALFLMILGAGSRSVRQYPHLEDLAKFNASATLLAMPGGLGTIIASLVFREIRAYNRISIYTAFMALFAVAILCDGIARNYLTTRSKRRIGLLCLLLVTSLGLYDQIPGILVPNHRGDQKQFANDREFVRRVERTVSARAMIFQLPFLEFPEGPPENSLNSYGQLRPGFHSRTLHWSFGSIKGRETSERIKFISHLDVIPMIAELKKEGFEGIVIHRKGYQDAGKALEKSLTDELGRGPTVSEDMNLSFFLIKSTK